MPSPTQTTASGNDPSDIVGLSQYEGWQHRATYLGGYTCTRPSSTKYVDQDFNLMSFEFLYGFCSSCISTFNLGARTGHDYTMEMEADLATKYSGRKQGMIVTAEIPVFFFSFSFLEQEGVFIK